MAENEETTDETTEETSEVEAEVETPAAEAEAETTPEPEAETPEPEAEAATPEPEPEPEAAPTKPARSLKHVPRSQRRTRTKVVREQPATRKPITRTEKPEAERGRRQERRGVVVSNAMDKTIVVKVDTIKAHPKYKKVVRRSKKFHAHDEQNAAKIGDVVKIVETRPLSKTKNWRLEEIVEVAK